MIEIAEVEAELIFSYLNEWMECAPEAVRESCANESFEKAMKWYKTRPETTILKKIDMQIEQEVEKDVINELQEWRFK